MASESSSPEPPSLPTAEPLRKLRAPEVCVTNLATPARCGFATAAEKALKDLASAAPVNHIRVAVRVRPVPPGDGCIIEVAGEGAIAITKEAGTGGNEWLRSQQGRVEERMFDRAFGPDATQAQVYAYCCQPLVRSAVTEGRSATIFVYGATGAGKTHTMFGERDESQHGCINRAICDTFKEVEAHSPLLRSGQLEVKVSFLDIYNENVRDLLQEGSVLCKVLEDERRGVVKVTNLKEVPVRSADEAVRHLRIGMQARKVESTAANARSSRSHAVFSMTLEHVGPAPRGPGDPVFQRRGAEPRRVHSRICLIDLAGSERATQTQNVGQALKDGAKINQSLLALANCIDALVPKNGSSTTGGREGAQTPRRKPPYRDSKLTLLLKGSLTSDCNVSMIANVHPGLAHFEDSNNTLEYAKRASVLKAPIVVRRARANSLPTSRPPSPSPPGSPVSSAGNSCELSLPVADTSAMVAAVARMDSTSSARHRGQADKAPAPAPKLSRTVSAPASGLPSLTPRPDSRLRARHSLEVEPSTGRPCTAVRRGIGIRPRTATPEVRIDGKETLKRKQARAAPTASTGLHHPQQQAPGVSNSCAGQQVCEDIRPAEVVANEHEGRSSGQKRLSLCSSIDASSSFGTASPGAASSGAFPEERPRPSLARSDEASAPLRETSASTARQTSASTTTRSATRSGSRQRDISLLELTPGEDGRRSTSISDASEELMLSPQGREDQPMFSARSQHHHASGSSHPDRRISASSTDRGISASSTERPPRSAGRPARHAASPVLARIGQPGSLPLGSPDATGAQSSNLLLRLVQSLQAEKAALDERVCSVELDNARLRAANLEKDRQLAAVLLSGLPNTATRESIGGCNSLLSGLTGCSPFAEASPRVSSGS